MFNKVKLDIDVPVQMRDGIVLRADIWQPASGDCFPAILVRLPYSKDSFFSSGGAHYMNSLRAVRSGYAVVVQDCRGTGSSGGEFFPWRDDPSDGFDSIEWIAAQPWCDGNIGMWGFSALGGTQWNAAIAQPPHLKVISPSMTPTLNRGLPLMENGAYYLFIMLSWYLNMCNILWRRNRLPPVRLKAIREQLDYWADHMDELLGFLPLKDSPLNSLAAELGLPDLYTNFYTNIDDGEFWKICGSPVPLEKIRVPALHVTGWYDPPLGNVLASYQAMLTRAGSDLSRRNQKLIIGPWIHGGGLPANADILKLGISAAGDITGDHLHWFDYWLKGQLNGLNEEPPVRIFILGKNIWRNENEWPLARTRYTRFYLHSRGQANGCFGGGSLNQELPASEPPDKYLYDPRSAPLAFSRGPEEKINLEKRPDVLIFDSEPLSDNLEVVGPVILNLFAASTARDTDFMAKVMDVFPDGHAINLNSAGGMVRARYRNGETNPSLIVPGEIYQYSLDLKSIGNVFKTGHRIRVQISSSNFPMWDRNPNTGLPIGQDSSMREAVQTILHDPDHPSYLVLPIINS
jgi:uncharacterized protein